jgi:hypothetical protein
MLLGVLPQDVLRLRGHAEIAHAEVGDVETGQARVWQARLEQARVRHSLQDNLSICHAMIIEHLEQLVLAKVYAASSLPTLISCPL